MFESISQKLIACVVRTPDSLMYYHLYLYLWAGFQHDETCCSLLQMNFVFVEKKSRGTDDPRGADCSAPVGRVLVRLRRTSFDVSPRGTKTRRSVRLDQRRPGRGAGQRSVARPGPRSDFCRPVVTVEVRVRLAGRVAQVADLAAGVEVPPARQRSGVVGAAVRTHHEVQIVFLHAVDGVIQVFMMMSGTAFIRAQTGGSRGVARIIAGRAAREAGP